MNTPCTKDNLGRHIMSIQTSNVRSGAERRDMRGNTEYFARVIGGPNITLQIRWV
jgi:hypothetical protein